MEKGELMGVLFLHGMALAAWFVPLGPVLDDAGLGGLKPLAFAASALAALLSPLFFGALADRSVPPARVLRWISVGTAVFVWLVAWSIQRKYDGWAVLVLIQLQSLFSVPTSSLSGSIVFSRLVHSQHQFGSIRALGTIGWMAGCWSVSLLQLDNSPRAFYVSGLLWLLVAAYTFWLPQDATGDSPPQRLTLRERFGLDALSLLKVHDHRVVFVTAALIAVPFAAFYPFTPAFLSDLGLQRVSAWTSLGQATEVVAMLVISGMLVRWRLKMVVVIGLAFGVLRYFLYATNVTLPVLAGVALHGFAFTFTYISAQIYLAQRIEAAWRTRAQALLSLMTGGLGNLAGYLFTGAWFQYCHTDGNTDWSLFWSGLCGIVVLVLSYFAMSYHGEK